MESIQVDGMNLREVMIKTSEMVEKTRADSEPRFIEALTCRFKALSVVDPDKYRSAADKEKFRDAGPIVALEHELKKSGLAEGSTSRRSGRRSTPRSRRTSGSPTRVPTRSPRICTSTSTPAIGKTGQSFAETRSSGHSRRRPGRARAGRTFSRRKALPSRAPRGAQRGDGARRK